MSDDLDDFYVHTITVQTLTGTGGMGDTYSAPLALAPSIDTGVLVEDKRRLVRSASGAEVVSETTVYARPAAASALTVGSLVTLPSGRIATVITCAAFDSGGLDLPDHIAAALT